MYRLGVAIHEGTCTALYVLYGHIENIADQEPGKRYWIDCYGKAVTPPGTSDQTKPSVRILTAADAAVVEIGSIEIVGDPAEVMFADPNPAFARRGIAHRIAAWVSCRLGGNDQKRLH